MATLIVIGCIGLAVVLYLREGGKRPAQSVSSSGCGCCFALGLLLFALLVYLGGLADSRIG